MGVNRPFCCTKTCNSMRKIFLSPFCTNPSVQFVNKKSLRVTRRPGFNNGIIFCGSMYHAKNTAQPANVKGPRFSMRAFCAAAVCIPPGKERSPEGGLSASKKSRRAPHRCPPPRICRGSPVKPARLRQVGRLPAASLLPTSGARSEPLPGGLQFTAGAPASRLYNVGLYGPESTNSAGIFSICSIARSAAGYNRKVSGRSCKKRELIPRPRRPECG